jgi:hypothetical protein
VGNCEGVRGTYETRAVAKDFVARECMQHFDDRSEPLQQFGIALPEFIKRPGLFLEYIKDRIGVVATIDPVSEWVVAEIFSSLLGVLGQGSIENGLEAGGRGGCIGSREHGVMGETSDVLSGRKWGW